MIAEYLYCVALILASVLLWSLAADAEHGAPHGMAEGAAGAVKPPAGARLNRPGSVPPPSLAPGI